MLKKEKLIKIKIINNHKINYNKMKAKPNIEISVLKGFKLFNQNTPFVINIIAHEQNEKEQEEKRVNADLICVIDISGSMDGEKLYQVKESLKILVDMMNEKDRIALILFESKAELYYDLNYLSGKNKTKIKNIIDKIESKGGTNIASGLEIAVELLKKLKKKNNKGRSSAVMLLSDGCDNQLDDLKLGEHLKSLTKGQGLLFTLNTFGYGSDHDPKIMKRLANLRDGSFFFVDDFTKVGEYFVSVLGGCISMVSNNAELQVKLLDKKCKIMKIFGDNNLFSFNLNNFLFTNKMLQFISGKEYTFVLEIYVDEFNVKPGDNLLDIDFIYVDILTKKNIKLNYKYFYQFKDQNFEKANDEYIRSQTYDVIEKALKLKEEGKNDKGQNILKEMENWLEKYYSGEIKSYLEDIKKTKTMLENVRLKNKDTATITNLVYQNISKKIGTDSKYSTSSQKKLMHDYCESYEISQKYKK